MIVIKNIKDVNYTEHDEVWAIVRSMKHPSLRMQQVESLAPSWNLFKQYRTLAARNEWNQTTFQNIYVPQFLQEMHTEDAKHLLNELYTADKNGKNICLVCFCPDETTCHRSIIAGMLQGAGCNVTGVKNDYSKYYKLWKNAAPRSHKR